MVAIKLKSDDRHYGDVLGRFRVRVAKEYSFTMEVEAHDGAEARDIAENFCEAMGGARWNALAENAHMTFEGEQICENSCTARKTRRR